MGKLRSKMLKDSAILAMGDYNVSPTHLQQVLETEPRLSHRLTASDLKGRDKMNFKAVENMTSPAVLEALQKQPDALGTSVYLEVMRYIMDAFLQADLPVKERVRLIWTATFFLRRWRSWLQETGRSLEIHFVTSNAYLCVEINAHGMIILIRKLRVLGRPELFLPDLYSSQPCEGQFRDARADTPKGSTAVNFSVMGLLRRNNRLQLQNDIVSKFGSEYHFPR